MLENKQGIIFGVANKRSIAWATAQALHEAGARLAFTYQGDRLKDNVEGLTKAEMPDSPLLSCDVTKQDEVDETFKRVGADSQHRFRTPRGAGRRILENRSRGLSHGFGD